MSIGRGGPGGRQMWFNATELGGNLVIPVNSTWRKNPIPRNDPWGTGEGFKIDYQPCAPGRTTPAPARIRQNRTPVRAGLRRGWAISRSWTELRYRPTCQRADM